MILCSWLPLWPDEAGAPAICQTRTPPKLPFSALSFRYPPALKHPPRGKTTQARTTWVVKAQMNAPFPGELRPRPGKKGPRNGVGPNAQNVGGKSPDWEIRASRPLPITDTRTATAGFPAAFLGHEFDSGNRASEQSSAARSNDSDF